MSFDFATQQVCPHEVIRETASLDPLGHLVVTFQRPPVNQSIRMEIDGQDVPPGGLFSTPRLPFMRPEPYRIKSGVSDLLYFRPGTDAPRFVQIISGSSVSAQDLAGSLRLAIPEVLVSVENKRVVLAAKNPGGGTAFSFPDPRWTDKTSSLPTTSRTLGACAQLGITPGRAVTGRLMYPGWAVSLDPQSVDGTGRIIRFNGPLLNHDPVIHLSYVTDGANCRRCFGSRIEFDYTILNGGYETVQDTDLLAQEFDKFVFTRLGSHWKWNWLGSGILDRIGGKGNAGRTTANAMIQVDVSTAFSAYQNIKQQQDSRFPFQKVSDAEYPATLLGIVVQSPPDDPTIAIAVTGVQSRSRVNVPLTRVVGNPSPFILGSGGVPFGFRG